MCPSKLVPGSSYRLVLTGVCLHYLDPTWFDVFSPGVTGWQGLGSHPSEDRDRSAAVRLHSEEKGIQLCLPVSPVGYRIIQSCPIPSPYLIILLFLSTLFFGIPEDYSIGYLLTGGIKFPRCVCYTLIGPLKYRYNYNYQWPHHSIIPYTSNQNVSYIRRRIETQWRRVQNVC